MRHADGGNSEPRSHGRVDCCPGITQSAHATCARLRRNYEGRRSLSLRVIRGGSSVAPRLSRGPSTLARRRLSRERGTMHGHRGVAQALDNGARRGQTRRKRSHLSSTSRSPFSAELAVGKIRLTPTTRWTCKRERRRECRTHSTPGIRRFVRRSMRAELTPRRTSCPAPRR